MALCLPAQPPGQQHPPFVVSSHPGETAAWHRGRIPEAAMAAAWLVISPSQPHVTHISQAFCGTPNPQIRSPDVEKWLEIVARMICREKYKPFLDTAEPPKGEKVPYNKRNR